jgi:hypothetical protein
MVALPTAKPLLLCLNIASGMKTKVYRKAFTTLGQDSLAVYADNVVRCCENSPALWQTLQSDVTALKAAAQEFHASLAALVNGGRLELARKKAAKAAVLAALRKTVQSIEYHDLGRPAILAAGLQPAKRHPGWSYSAPPRPERLQVAAIGISGAVLVKYHLPARRRVSTNVIEYSADGGMSWQHGAYCHRSRVVLTDLPIHQYILVRVCSIGSRLQSGWTEPVGIAVQ